MDGILIADKKEELTSFDVVRDVRKEFNIKKVGHVGTLDPMATGVLVVLIGKATKLSDYLMLHDKEYIAELKLGIKTDTGDRTGNIIEQDKNFFLKKWCKTEYEKTYNEIKTNLKNENVQDILCNSTIEKNVNENKEIGSNINNDESIAIMKILNSFIGEQEQIPPMYSAIKVNGKKLYELARSNIEIERKPRKINIYNIEILKINYDKNIITFKVCCSKGTYIRTLCEDIANKIGTIGTMNNLRRTRVGNFKIEEAGKFIEFENILKYIEREPLKISINDSKNYEKFLNGIELKRENYNILCDEKEKSISKEKLCNVYFEDKYLGIGKIKNQSLKRNIIL